MAVKKRNYSYPDIASIKRVLGAANVAKIVNSHYPRLMIDTLHKKFVEKQDWKKAEAVAALERYLNKATEKQARRRNGFGTNLAASMIAPIAMEAVEKASKNLQYGAKKMATGKEKKNPVRILNSKRIEGLTPAQLRDQLSRSEKIVSALNQQLINAGRGRDKFSDTVAKASIGDRLAAEYVAAVERQRDLFLERERRLRYSGTLKPIKTNPSVRDMLEKKVTTGKGKSSKKANPRRSVPTTKRYVAFIYNTITNDWQKLWREDDLNDAIEAAMLELTRIRSGMRIIIKDSLNEEIVFDKTANPSKRSPSVQHNPTAGEKNPGWFHWIVNQTDSNGEIFRAGVYFAETKSDAIRDAKRDAIILFGADAVNKSRFSAEKAPPPKKKVRQSARKNPSITDISKTFQGKANGKSEDLKAASTAPANLSRAGKLASLKIQGRRSLLRVPDAVVAIDTKGRLWLASKHAPMFTKKAHKGEGLDYGEIESIAYITAKAHIGDGKTFEYIHEFGEEGGRRPHLIIDDEGMPIIKGGDYTIRSEGIIN